MFAVTNEARRYINDKGRHIRIYLETILVCNRSCQAPQGFRCQTVVQLGQPQSNEKEFFASAELDGITIWYEPGSILPQDPEKPIRIRAKKTLFLVELQVEGVKQQG